LINNESTSNKKWLFTKAGSKPTNFIHVYWGCGIVPPNQWENYRTPLVKLASPSLPQTLEHIYTCLRHFCALMKIHTSNELGKPDHADGMMVLASVVTVVHNSVLCNFLASCGTTVTINLFLLLNCLRCKAVLFSIGASIVAPAQLITSSSCHIVIIVIYFVSI